MPRLVRIAYWRGAPSIYRAVRLDPDRPGVVDRPPMGGDASMIEEKYHD